jgi:uncharacterized protein
VSVPPVPPSGDQPPQDQPPGHGQPYGQLPSYGAAGQYNPQYGYGPPGVPQQQQPGQAVTGDDTTWAMISYLGSLLFTQLVALVIYFAKKKSSPFARFHAAQTLNYVITVLIQVLAPLLVAVPLTVLLDSPVWMVLAVPMVVIHTVGQFVFLILGAVRASQGKWWRMPTWTCWPMIR